MDDHDKFKENGYHRTCMENVFTKYFRKFNNVNFFTEEFTSKMILTKPILFKEKINKTRKQPSLTYSLTVLLSKSVNSNTLLYKLLNKAKAYRRFTLLFFVIKIVLITNYIRFMSRNRFCTAKYKITVLKTTYSTNNHYH